MKLPTSIPLTLCLTAIVLLSSIDMQACSAQSPGGSVRAPASPLARAEAAVLNAQRNFQRHETELREATKSLEASETQLQKLLVKESELGVSLESFPDMIRTLQTQRIELMIEMAGMDAKREVLIESLKEKEDESNEEYELLQDIYAQYAKIYGRTKSLVEKGTRSTSDLIRAKLSLSESRLRLIRAKPRTSDSKENAAMLELSIERAESKARLAKTEELLATIAKARPVLSERENLDRSRELARQRMVTLTKQLNNSQSLLRDAEEHLKRMEEQE